MSGIVVLALLSGGIIIIMAAVCLQRATSKRYDFVSFKCLHFPLPSLNRLNQAEPATLAILLFWAFLRGSFFLYFIGHAKLKLPDLVGPLSAIRPAPL